jgi:hypothetical protein
LLRPRSRNRTATRRRRDRRTGSPSPPTRPTSPTSVRRDRGWPDAPARWTHRAGSARPTRHQGETRRERPRHRPPEMRPTSAAQSSTSSSATYAIVPHQGLSSVGATGFEPATFRPPADRLEVSMRP